MMKSGAGTYIAHLDLDCFFVSVERIKNSALRGKPVIVGGSPGGRGVVASASYEARAFGVRSAMPTAQALRLCPSAIVVQGHHDEYSVHSRRLYKRLHDFSPLVECASIDEFYMDFSGCTSLYENDLPGFIKKLQGIIQDEFHLPCTIALASNKMIAKIAANTVKPNGVIHIPEGKEEQFLAPLPVEALPGVGTKTAEMLRNKNVRIIADLQKVSLESLVTLLGAHGNYLHRAAHGRGSTIVVPDRERKSISREETFGHDITDVGELKEFLFTLTESVCSTLRSKNQKAKCVTLKLRYHDFETLTRQQMIEPTSYDPVVFATASELFLRCYQPTKPVRLIGVGLSHFVDDGETEPTLFPIADKQHTMLEAVDRLRKKFGDDVIHVGGA